MSAVIIVDDVKCNYGSEAVYVTHTTCSAKFVKSPEIRKHFSENLELIYLFQ